MLATGNGVGNSIVDEPIARLFVPDVQNEEVGFYAVRLMLNQSLVPVIVDDLFPIIADEKKWTNENRGIAAAHSAECSQIWVSIVEKAFAKLYGGYNQLSGGYVQHALHVMTGTAPFPVICNADEVRLRRGDN